MKVLYLKDNYDILLKIRVPDVAYLKRIKRANRFFVYIRNTPPSFPPPNPPPQKKNMIDYGMAVLECLQGRTQNFSPGGSKAYMPKVPIIRRIINDILKIVNIVFSREAIPPP